MATEGDLLNALDVANILNSRFLIRNQEFGGRAPSRAPKYLTVVRAVFTPAALTLCFSAPGPSATELFESRNKFKTAATKQRRIEVEYVFTSALTCGLPLPVTTQVKGRVRARN